MNGRWLLARGITRLWTGAVDIAEIEVNSLGGRPVTAVAMPEAEESRRRGRELGEVSVYYVPNDQDTWSGRAEELADLLWDQGVFLDTPTIMDRLRTFRGEGRPFPVCNLDIDQKFGGMGVSDESEDHPVPNSISDIQCPHCGHDLLDAAYDAWQTESDLALMDRVIECSRCNSSTATKRLKYGESMSFARFYVFVSDCDQEDWDPRFRTMLETILGPCNEYWEWST